MEYIFTMLCTQALPQRMDICLTSSKAAWIQSGANADYDLVQDYVNKTGSKAYSIVETPTLDALGGAAYCIKNKHVNLGPLSIEPNYINFHLEF